MRKIKISLIIIFAITFFVGCNDHPSSGSSGSGTEFISSSPMVVLHLGVEKNELSAGNDLWVPAEGIQIIVIKDDLDIDSSVPFTVWEITPGQQGELYTAIRSYLGKEEWMPNLHPAELQDVDDLEVLLSALLCSQGEENQCIGYFPEGLFNEISTEKLSFSLDYPGERIFFLFYKNE